MVNHPNRSRRQTHDRMTAWACVTTLMRYIGQEDVLFGEWVSYVGEDYEIDPVEVARRIVHNRNLAAISSTVE